MLDLLGRAVRLCDGIPRRAFLRAGALACAGLTLGDLLRSEAKSHRGSRKAVINIHLDGGPPQMDTFDMKPEGPSETRGEFSPIPTALPGFQICEWMPRTAAIANRFAVLRTVVGSIGQHHAFQCQSGFAEESLRGIGGRPALGCVAAKLFGSAEDPAPPFVDMMQGRGLVRNSARPGFLGPSFGPFRPQMDSLFARPLEEGMQAELARRGSGHTSELTLLPGLSMNRLSDRRQLLASLDRIRRDLDSRGMMEAMDHFDRQAVGILTSGAFADALDYSREDARVLNRYTPPASRLGAQSTTSEGPESARKFLIARRLVEAGVRCVSLSLSDFDTHSSNFPRMRNLLPILDAGLAALVLDLEERGMLDNVTVIAWGEFGRTPKINKNGGRDHWPRVSPALIVGGGLRGGQIIGATDSQAAEPIERPVHYQDVIATLYHALGIDPTRTTIDDPHGRPQYLVESGRPIEELV